MNDLLDFGDVIDAAVDTGFEPADECLIQWIADRYEGFQPLPRRSPLPSKHAGYLCFNTIDGEVHLYNMSSTGVCRAQATFTLNPRGLMMFVAAANQAREAL